MVTLSILTCVIGEPESLRATANSIKPFLSEKLNWIIKFSEKTDRKFIENYSGSYIKVDNKPDLSLYDAMNQCLALSNADYYIVVGAGDTILPDSMELLVRLLNSGEISEASYHAPILFSATGAVSQPSPNLLKYFMSCSHPSSIYRVKNSLAIGGFDSSYKIAADYDHMSRYAKAFGYGVVLNVPPLVSFMGGGMSDNRVLEGKLEVSLVRIRVWNTPDIRIYGDLLHETATTIADNIRHNFS
jgi:glycosyltransferase involved in cell wall biosynthesis